MLSELFLAASVIAIAAMLFPVLKRHNEGLATGYVGARIIEGVIIVIGGMSSLLMLSLSEKFVQGGDSESSEFGPSGTVLLELREWTDALGPALVFGISALILYGMLYRSELVPRWLSSWGFVGAVLIVVAGVRGMYGHSPTSTISVLLTVPIGLNEMVLAVWLIIRGFQGPRVAPEPAEVRRFDADLLDA